MVNNFFAHVTAQISNTSNIGNGVKVWNNTQIRELAQIGQGTSIGANSYIGPGVKIGEFCKIQNNVQLYEPCEIGDYVFIGPGVIITNDKYPRSFNKDLQTIKSDEWNKTMTKIESYTSLGAGVICVGPSLIQKFSMVGAGAVISGKILSHGLYVGVPAKKIKWIDKYGEPLNFDTETRSFHNKTKTEFYKEINGELLEC